MKNIDRLTTRIDGMHEDSMRRHITAVAWPSEKEKPLLHMLEGWLEYADQYRNRYLSGIQSDYFIGPLWFDIGQALLGLLNGEIGRLDGGTLDGIIRDTLDYEDKHRGGNDASISSKQT